MTGESRSAGARAVGSPGAQESGVAEAAHKADEHEAGAAPVAEILQEVLEELEDHKASDVKIIDLDGKAEFARYMVIATGSSHRHVGVLASSVEQRLKRSGHRGGSLEGRRYCDWVLVDAGEVVVHLFRPEVRKFYDLERMWDAPCPQTRRSA